MSSHNPDDQNNNTHSRRTTTPVGARRESQRIWRMEQVLKYASLGYNQAEIAAVLYVDQSQVSRAITAITKAAQQDIQHHIEEVLPYERRKALTLFENIKRRAIEIADKESIGDRDRIAALSLAKDAGREIISLQQQGEHVRTALNIATGLQAKLNNLQQQGQQEKDNKEEGQQQQGEEELPLYDYEYQ